MFGFIAKRRTQYYNPFHRPLSSSSTSSSLNIIIINEESYSSNIKRTKPSDSPRICTTRTVLEPSTSYHITFNLLNTESSSTHTKQHNGPKFKETQETKRKEKIIELGQSNKPKLKSLALAAF